MTAPREELKAYIASCDNMKQLLELILLSEIPICNTQQFITQELNEMRDDMINKICTKIIPIRDKILLTSGWVRIHYGQNIPFDIIELIRSFLNKAVIYEKGSQLDIKITNEHQETFWTTGTICRCEDDKVQLSINKFLASH